MNKGRLEAFSDGVIAIIITIMVLELKVPHGEGFEALKPVVPTLLAIVAAFWGPLVSHVIYVSVALMWLIPDRRIERTLAREKD
jgi:uncharacterized membrane protein